MANGTIIINGIEYSTEPSTNLCEGCDLLNTYGKVYKCTAPEKIDCRRIIFKKSSSNIPRFDENGSEYCDVYNYDAIEEYKDVRLFPAVLIFAPLILVAGILVIIFYPIYKLKKRINNGKRKKSSTHGCNK